MTDLRSRYAKLQALADDQAGTPEGDLAASMAAAMIERFPELEAPEAPPVKRVIATRHAFDVCLLTRIATWLGLEAYRVGHRRPDGKGVRWREGLQVVGTEDLVELVDTFYQAHRAHLDELLKWTAVGYAVGAFPRTREDEDADEDAPRLTPEQLAAARAGLEAGKRHQAAVPVPRTRWLTEAED